MRVLEAAGYVCTKAGGSLGLFDVIAVGALDVRLIQVKAGTKILVGDRARADPASDGAGERQPRGLAVPGPLPATDY
jgi:hypothetical protein